jgi:hypothetical protein
MLCCRAALLLSRKTLTFVAGLIRRHRIWTGSQWRKLNPGQQALLVLACRRKGETFAGLAAGFGFGTATAWRRRDRRSVRRDRRRSVILTGRRAG